MTSAAFVTSGRRSCVRWPIWCGAARGQRLCHSRGRDRTRLQSQLQGDDLDAFLRFARSFFAPILTPGRHAIAPDAGLEAGRLAQDKRQLARFGVPGQLLFLFRVRFGLYAVLSRIGAVVDWGGLESTFAAQTAASWGALCRYFGRHRAQPAAAS